MKPTAFLAFALIIGGCASTDLVPVTNEPEWTGLDFLAAGVKTIPGGIEIDFIGYEDNPIPTCSDLARGADTQIRISTVDSGEAGTITTFIAPDASLDPSADEASFDIEGADFGSGSITLVGVGDRYSMSFSVSTSDTSLPNIAANTPATGEFNDAPICD